MLLAYYTVLPGYTAGTNFYASTIGASRATSAFVTTNVRSQDEVCLTTYGLKGSPNRSPWGG
jgi:hypothetical protein